MADEKADVAVQETHHVEKPSPNDTVEDVKGRDFTVTDSELPSGYFRSARFLGSMFAIGSAFGCGVAGFTFAAPILAYINADLGPSKLWSRLATAISGLMSLNRCKYHLGRSRLPPYHRNWFDPSW